MKQAMKNKTEVVRTKMHELIENSHAPPKEGSFFIYIAPKHIFFLRKHQTY